MNPITVELLNTEARAALARLKYGPDDVIRISLTCLEHYCETWREDAEKDLDAEAYTHYSDLLTAARAIRALIPA